ncbi:MAG TPA: glycosyltransferase family 39 protein [Solirubrobacter sp.]|nr:glycosyltransferase family 39 protein [Solirubrobacter sp.]
MRRRLPFILLALVVLTSFGLNARVAANPRSAYESEDERAYGKLAVNIADQHAYGGYSTHMKEPRRWPPGAPLLFAAGYKLFGSPDEAKSFDIRAVYWEQAILTTGTTALAGVLVWLLAGPWAAVLAAALVGTYPPLIGATGDQLSEPLGAFLVIAAFTVLAFAVRRRAVWWWAGAGAVFGLAVLTRADLLPVPFAVAGLGALIVLVRERAWRRALLTWGTVAAATVVVLAPWTIYASRAEHQFIPVTKGSPAALFVGTYLPGGGTTVGMKRALEPELRAKHPGFRDTKVSMIPATFALKIIADRHPGMPRDEALQREARHNLFHYPRTQPLAFAKMQWAKAKRMWLFYYRGGGVHYISTAMRIWQVVLVLGCGAGLLFGLIRRRDPVLGAILLTIALSTAVHTIVVSQARYNLPLMPALIAGGVAGWWLGLRRAPGPSPSPATIHEWSSDRSASGTAPAGAASTS